MRQRQKRRRRVEILIDQRLLSFMKPISAGPASAPRKRDSLDFMALTDEESPPELPRHRAS